MIRSNCIVYYTLRSFQICRTKVKQAFCSDLVAFGQLMVAIGDSLPQSWKVDQDEVQQEAMSQMADAVVQSKASLSASTKKPKKTIAKWKDLLSCAICLAKARCEQMLLEVIKQVHGQGCRCISFLQSLHLDETQLLIRTSDPEEGVRSGLPALTDEQLALAEVALHTAMARAPQEATKAKLV